MANFNANHDIDESYSTKFSKVEFQLRYALIGAILVTLVTFFVGFFVRIPTDLETVLIVVGAFLGYLGSMFIPDNQIRR